jgi:hypothetical protein
MVFGPRVTYVRISLDSERGQTSNNEVSVSTVVRHDHAYVGMANIDPSAYTTYSQFCSAIAEGLNNLQNNIEPVYARGDWELVRIDCHNGVQSPCTVDEGNFQLLYDYRADRPYQVRAVVDHTNQRRLKLWQYQQIHPRTVWDSETPVLRGVQPAWFCDGQYATMHGMFDVLHRRVARLEGTLN